MNKILQNMARRNMAKAAAMMLMMLGATQQSSASMFDTVMSTLSRYVPSLAGCSPMVSNLVGPAVAGVVCNHPFLSAVGTAAGSLGGWYTGRKVLNYFTGGNKSIDNKNVEDNATQTKQIKNIQNNMSMKAYPTGNNLGKSLINQQKEPDLATSLSNVDQDDVLSQEVQTILVAGEAIGLPGKAFKDNNGNTLVTIGSEIDNFWKARGYGDTTLAGQTISLEQYNQYIEEYNDNAFRNLSDSVVSEEFFNRKIKSSGLTNDEVDKILQAGGEFVRRGNKLKVDFGTSGVNCTLNDALNIAERKAK